jgi:hypothetical protein
MSTSPPSISIFDPDAVSTSDFPWVLETASDLVAQQLLTTPYFGFLAAVVCEVEDKDVLCDVQQLLMENPVDFGASFSSGLWTVSEVISYLNQRQDDFLRRTSILQRRQRLSYNLATHTVDLPQDLIVIRRLVYIDADITEARYTPIARGDTWELDHGNLAWEYEAKPPTFPLVYSDAEGQQLVAKLGPGSFKKGVVEALYVPRGPRLSNTGVCMSVPGEFTGSIRWGVIADMLRKMGRAQDLARAAYAESRYELGVGAANLMLAGWA